MPNEIKIKKILVADDEKALANALALKLKHSGFDVQLAFNGEEVLELLKKDHFDLLLLDMIMPRLNGFRVLEEIKKQNLNVPVMITSNLSQVEDIKFAEAMGVAGYFPKADIPLYELVEKIKNFLN